MGELTPITSRQIVTLKPGSEGRLVTHLFAKPDQLSDVPPEVWVVEVPEAPPGETYRHSYGKLTPFFKGLTEGRLVGTRCREDSCADIGIRVPPEVHCPDCLKPSRWEEVDATGAKVYTYSTTFYPGLGFRLENILGEDINGKPIRGGVVLISVEIPGVSTRHMSYLKEFRPPEEPYIGMPVRPGFLTENPTYTIDDLYWVPDDARMASPTT